MKEILFLAGLLLLGGCAGVAEKRVEYLDGKIDQVATEIDAAKAAGDEGYVVELKKEMSSLRGERTRAQKAAATEAGNRQILLLTILGMVSGGLKWAAATFGKEAIA